MPLSRGRNLRRAGAGDPDVAGGRAGAAAGDGRGRSKNAAALLIVHHGRGIAPSSWPGSSRPSTSFFCYFEKKEVDAWHKAGHDGVKYSKLPLGCFPSRFI